MRGLRKAKGRGKFKVESSKLNVGGEKFSIVGERGMENLSRESKEGLRRLEELELAKRLLKFGGKMDAIRFQTGWELGADGKWRTELPDLKIKPDTGNVDMDNATLKDIVDAPELFQAYPELAETPVIISKFADENGNLLNVYAAYDQAEDCFAIHPDIFFFSDSSVINTIMIHEVQHKIQRIEGFARGGNPQMFQGKSEALKAEVEAFRKKADASEKYRRMEELDREFGKIFATGTDEEVDAWNEKFGEEYDALENDPEVKSIKEEESDILVRYGNNLRVLEVLKDPGNEKALEAIALDDDLYKKTQYRRLAGEVEARNAERRSEIPMEQRLRKLLSATEDVAEKDKIYLEKAVGEAMAMAEEGADEQIGTDVNGDVRFSIDENVLNAPVPETVIDFPKVDITNAEAVRAVLEKYIGMPITIKSDGRISIFTTRNNRASLKRHNKNRIATESLDKVIESAYPVGWIVGDTKKKHNKVLGQYIYAASFNVKDSSGNKTLYIARISLDGMGVPNEGVFKDIAIKKAEDGTYVRSDLQGDPYRRTSSAPFTIRELIEKVKADYKKTHQKYFLEEIPEEIEQQRDLLYERAVKENPDYAKDMLRRAAKRKGYNLPGENGFRDGHGAPGDMGFDFENGTVEDYLDDGSDTNLVRIAEGFNPQPDDYFDDPRGYGYDDQEGLEAQRNLKKVLNQIKAGDKSAEIVVYRAVPNDVKVSRLQNGDWISPSRQYAVNHGESRFGEGEYRIVEEKIPAKHLWWDGNDIREWGYDNGNEEATANVYGNRKILDITYDDNGKLIPLSKRFDSDNNDPRFSVESYSEEDWANMVTFMKPYVGRAMERNDADYMRHLQENGFEVANEHDAQIIASEALKANQRDQRAAGRKAMFDWLILNDYWFGRIYDAIGKTDFLIRPSHRFVGEDFTGSYISPEFVKYSGKLKVKDKEAKLEKAKGYHSDELAKLIASKTGGDELQIEQDLIDYFRHLKKRSSKADKENRELGLYDKYSEWKNSSPMLNAKLALYEADTGNALIEVLFPAENIDFHAEELDIDITPIQTGHSDRIFFRGHDEFRSRGFRIVDEIDQFLLTITVMIGIMTLQDQRSAEILKKTFKTCRIRNRGNRCKFFVLKRFQRMAVSAFEHLFQILGLVTAFDDFRTVIVLPDEILQMTQTRRSVGFRQENIIRPLDMLDRLAHQPARQNVMIIERRSGIHQDDIDVRLQTQILESVIEDQHIGPELLDRIKSGFDAVLIDQHGDILEIGSQHIWFIARGNGVMQKIFPIGDNAGRNFHFSGEETLPQFSEEGALVAASVTAAQNSHAASFLRKSPRKDFDDRGLSCSPAGQIPDLHDEASDRTVPDDARIIDPGPDQDRPEIEAGCNEEDPFDKGIEGRFPFFTDKLDEILFDVFADFADGHDGQSPRISS